MATTSFSQNMTFNRCPKWWWYLKVKQIPVISDMCYADAGNVLHKCLELFYKGNIKTLDVLKVEFNNLWQTKNLDSSKIKNKKDEYWLMVVNGTNLNLKLTSNELKIFYPDVVAFIDGVNTETDEIIDWKSSTRREENEEEYTRQLKFYSYLYYRKFSRMIKKATVYYLKYNGSKQELIIEPTMDDMLEMDEWHNDIKKEMDLIRFKNIIPPRCTSCHMFCPYINVCSEQTDGVLKYTLHISGDNIQLDGQVTPLLDKGLTKKFSYELKNAFFIKRKNPYAKTNVQFWNIRNRTLPIGFKDGLIKTLTDYATHKKLELALDVEDHREFNETKIVMPDKFINDRELRDYQIEAVDKFLRKKVGILELGTGSGKTEISIEIIRRLGIKTLFVVDKIELLKQTKKRIESALGIEVGQIGDSIEDIKDITVATIQTLTKNITKYSKYLQSIRFCIFDECHKVAASSYFKVSKYLINTEYRLGLSATSWRDDGNDMLIEAVVGDKCFILSAKDLINDGFLVSPNITFIKNYMNEQEIKELENKCSQGLINETPNYQIFYPEFISKNNKRNNVIKEIVEKNKDKKILILTKLVEHGEYITSTIFGAKHLYGGTSKEDRKKIFDEFSKSDGALKTLVGTLSIFSEGIDIPSLDIVINASANRGDVKSIQILGRVLRLFKEKNKAMYYDFVDEYGFFKAASLARMRAFKKQGHNVNIENQHI